MAVLLNVAFTAPGKIITWIFLMASFLYACDQKPRSDNSTPIELAILSDQKSFYFVDFSANTQPAKHLPIGVFDSGTGGLTVLNALL